MRALSCNRKENKRKLITIYSRFKSNPTLKKVKKWADFYNIEYRTIHSRDISENIIKDLLKSSSSIYDILIPWEKGQKTWKTLDINQNSLENMSMNKLIKLLTEHPILLKNLILFDEKCILVDYHEEKIRTFLPALYRKVYRNKDF